MSTHRFALFSLLLLVLGHTASQAAAENVELLWPQGAPGAKGDQPADKPTLTVFPPEQHNAVGAAVVICPGGAYRGLATDHEGRQIAAGQVRYGDVGAVDD